MAETVTMPKLGFDMAEGILVRWVKKEGDPVNIGDVLAEIETDKATVEVESPYAGVVARHLVSQSTSVPVGDPIAIVTAVGESLGEPDTKPESTQKPKEELPVSPSGKPEPQPIHASEEGPSVTGVLMTASPLARRMANEYQIDLGTIKGTGPNGRIVRRDVEAAFAKSTTPVLTAASPTPSYPQVQTPGTPRKDERVPLNKLRSAIGRRMVESKQSIPHFYVTRSIHADRLMELRQQYNNVAPDEEKLSVNDFIVKAAAMALSKFPGINASLVGNEIIRHGQINIGIAVTIEGGLLTIVVKEADRKDLRAISMEVKEMITRARQGKVKTEDIEGSTFSISNLGMFDVENFAAIINPPEAAILAVGAVHETPVVVNGQVQAGKLMKVTISADHRVTDGAEAAQFMQELTRLLENPVWLVM